MIHHIFLALLPFLILHLPCITTCPTNATLRQVCKCESTFNGILLDCSSPTSSEPVDTSLVIRTLQDNRAQLGLIQELLLRNGTLRQLQSRAFEGLYIKKLDLSSNELENISSDAFHGLENVLQILTLSHNFLTKFPTSALNNMLVLLQLDLSDNDIEDLQEQDTLRGTPKLYDLNLANNRICNIHKQVFDDVKQTIQTLNLGGNCFEKVPASAVRGFKQLLALHLHNNRIEQLEPLQFMNLPSLNLINLARNRIEAVHRQSFLNVPNLRFMYLSDNNITKLESNEFRTFDNLELLDLTRNRIRTIPGEAFLGMPRLSQLYLGENGIERIEANAFANSSLVILLLPNNELTELRADMFQGLTYLQQFSLKGNKITRISSNTFYQMPSLVVVDLSDNLLTNLEPATFLAQLNLFLLDLSRNKLPVTPHNAFNRRIVTVVLQDNPLVCTERVHVLQNGVGVNVPGTVDTVCGDAFSTSSLPSQPGSTGQNTALQGTDSAQSGTNVPAFVQETPTTDIPLLIQRNSRPSTPRSNPNIVNIANPINSTLPNVIGFPLGGDPGSGNPFVTSPNIGNGNNFGGQNVPGGFGGIGGRPNVVPNFVRPTSGGPIVGNPGVRSPNVGSGNGSGGPVVVLPPSGPIAVNPGNPNLGGPVNVNSNVGPASVGNPGIAGAGNPGVPAAGNPGVPAAGNPGIPGPNGGNPNIGIPNPGAPNIGAPIPGDFANGAPLAPANFGPFVNPNIPNINTPNPGQQGAPAPRIPSPPRDNSNGKSDQQPFGLTPLLTIVPTSNNTNHGSGSGSRQSASFVPGIVEQVPLENEGQGGVIGANKPPPPPEGQNPDFSWTWGPAQSGQVPTRQIPSWTLPNPGPDPSSLGPSIPFSFSFSPPISIPASASTPALPSDVITAVPAWTNSRSFPSHSPPSTHRRPDVDDSPPELKTVPPKKHRPEDEPDAAAAAAGEVDANTGSASGANATTTIAVCLTVVVVVMISVFITLCVVRHRNRANSRQSVSSASRTSAYVAAQTARMNYAQSTYGVVGNGGGTGAYMREVGPNRPTMGTLQRAGTATPTNNQAWIYAPGTYASPSAYYK